MKRYFTQIQYRGTNFAGWQSQPNANTVQNEIEQQLAKVLQTETKIVGCGRTDSGVHASDYIFHFDADVDDPDHLIFKLNKMVSKDIAFSNIAEVAEDAHARFDALKRSYKYHIHKQKNPFKTGISHLNTPLFEKELGQLQEVADLFLMFDDFNTFCKTNTDVKTTICKIHKSKWKIKKNTLTFHIQADRFLRGMVRLMVGCCLNVANGILTMDEVKQALYEKRRLERDLSVPAEGLFLNKITYPARIFK